MPVLQLTYIKYSSNYSNSAHCKAQIQMYELGYNYAYKILDIYKVGDTPQNCKLHIAGETMKAK